MAKKTISVCDAKGCGKELETPVIVKVGTVKKEICPDCEKKLLMFLGVTPIPDPVESEAAPEAAQPIPEPGK